MIYQRLWDLLFTPYMMCLFEQIWFDFNHFQCKHSFIFTISTRTMKFKDFNWINVLDTINLSLLIPTIYYCDFVSLAVSWCYITWVVNWFYDLQEEKDKWQNGVCYKQLESKQIKITSDLFHNTGFFTLLHSTVQHLHWILCLHGIRDFTLFPRRGR